MSQVIIESGLETKKDLTFSKIKEILTSACEVNLETTKLLTGQKVFMSFVDGKAKVIINSSDKKTGGITAAQVSDRISDKNKSDSLKNAVNAFEKIINSYISHQQQKEIFEEADTDNLKQEEKRYIYYFGFEIMDHSGNEMVNYDTKTFILNHSEYKKIDYSTGKELPVDSNDASDRSNKLEKIINSAQDDRNSESHHDEISAFKRLNSLSDKVPLNTAINKINSLLSSVNDHINNDQLSLSDESSIDDFMLARVIVYINTILKHKNITVDPTVKVAIAKTVMGVGGISIVDISKKLDDKDKKYIKENIINPNSKKAIIKKSIYPLELIINNFTVDMLKGMKSLFILTKNKELIKLAKDIDFAIKNINNIADNETKNILKNEIRNLKKADSFSSVNDGFTFILDNKLYKFNGSYEPVGKLLSLLNYKSEIEQLSENTFDINDIINEVLFHKKEKYSLLRKKKKVKEMAAAGSSGAVAGYGVPLIINRNHTRRQ